ncbi:MAG: glycosyltransferase family 2 protein [Actinobacteria bacterium]|nr:glycosyltransferase family 2 protein [Actinomycetota bacterium]
MKLSVIVPAFNEAPTIAAVLRRVAAVDVAKEIIVVDDSSTDATATEIAGAGVPDVKVIRHRVNRGKGAAVRTGLAHVTGDVVVIQDGDLEYDPQDFVRLLGPIASGEARVVYGYRDLASQVFFNRLGNRFLTLLTNLLFGVALRDMETCYKMWRREVLEGVTLRASAFDIEVELTATFIRLRERIVQLPITYQAREAKKLQPWRDGPQALVKLLRYRFGF